MKKLQKWLLPILTGLVALAAVLLPPRLSQMQDRRLLGQVHTEALAAENGLTALPPVLEERIRLLARWQAGDAALAVAAQEVEEQETLVDLAVTELGAMEELGALPLDLLFVESEELFGERLVLQDQETGAGASFLSVSRYRKGEVFCLVLDEESGRILRLEIGSPLLRKTALDLAETGIAFFSRLGVEGKLLGAGPGEALFQIAGTELQYIITADDWLLGIRPVSSSSSSALAVSGTMDAG